MFDDAQPDASAGFAALGLGLLGPGPGPGARSGPGSQSGSGADAGAGGVGGAGEPGFGSGAEGVGGGAASVLVRPETGDLVIDAVVGDLAATPPADLDLLIDAGERVQRTLQGRLADLGG